MIINGWQEQDSCVNSGMKFYIHVNTKWIVGFERKIEKWTARSPSAKLYPINFDSAKDAMKVVESIFVKKT